MFLVVQIYPNTDTIVMLNNVLISRRTSSNSKQILLNRRVFDLKHKGNKYILIHINTAIYAKFDKIKLEEHDWSCTHENDIQRHVK